MIDTTEVLLVKIEIVVDNAENVMVVKYYDEETGLDDSMSYVLSRNELINSDYTDSIQEFLLKKAINDIMDKKIQRMLTRQPNG